MQTDAGVLTSKEGTDRQGRGVHRVYSLNEVAIAAIAAELNSRKMPIGEIKSVTAKVRFIMDSFFKLVNDLQPPADPIGINSLSAENSEVMYFGQLFYWAMENARTVFMIVVRSPGEVPIFYFHCPCMEFRESLGTSEIYLTGGPKRIALPANWFTQSLDEKLEGDLAGFNFFECFRLNEVLAPWRQAKQDFGL